MLDKMFRQMKVGQRRNGKSKNDRKTRDILVKEDAQDRKLWRSLIRNVHPSNGNKDSRRRSLILYGALFKDAILETHNTPNEACSMSL